MRRARLRSSTVAPPPPRLPSIRSMSASLSLAALARRAERPRTALWIRAAASCTLASPSSSLPRLLPRREEDAGTTTWRVASAVARVTAAASTAASGGIARTSSCAATPCSSSSSGHLSNMWLSSPSSSSGAGHALMYALNGSRVE